MAIPDPNPSDLCSLRELSEFELQWELGRRGANWVGNIPELEERLTQLLIQEGLNPDTHRFVGWSIPGPFRGNRRSVAPLRGSVRGHNPSNLWLLRELRVFELKWELKRRRAMWLGHDKQELQDRLTRRLIQERLDPDTHRFLGCSCVPVRDNRRNRLPPGMRLPLDPQSHDANCPYHPSNPAGIAPVAIPQPQPHQIAAWLNAAAAYQRQQDEQQGPRAGPQP